MEAVVYYRLRVDLRVIAFGELVDCFSVIELGYFKIWIVLLAMMKGDSMVWEQRLIHLFHILLC